MVWFDGTSTIYNGYQDLGLLDNTTLVPRKPSFPPILASADPNVRNSVEFDPQAVILTPVMSPARQLERVKSNDSSKSLPEKGNIQGSPEVSDIEEPSVRKSVVRNQMGQGNLYTSKVKLSQSQPASGRDSEADDSGEEGSRPRSSLSGREKRSDSIKGTFNIKSSPQLSLNHHNQPMAQPFMIIGKHLPIDRGIICLGVSPSKDLLVTVTMSSVELWSLNPTLFLCQMTRSTDSVVSDGANADISWKGDSRAFCVFTARGHLYFYNISVKEGAGLNATLPLDVDEDNDYNLVSGLSDVMHQSTKTNPHSWWIRNPGKFFGLQLTKVVAVEPGIRCFLSLDDDVLVATQKNASIVNYSWKDKVQLGSLNLAQEAASFLSPADVMVNQMVYDAVQGVFGWLTTDGSVYLVRRKISLQSFSSGTPYEWQGMPCHSCDGTPETYATIIAINPQHYLVAAVMRSNMIYIYSYGKAGLAAHKSHTFRVGSQVTCISWSGNGLSLAIGTTTKGLLVFEVYDLTADVTTSNGRFGAISDQNEDPYSHRVHCLAWCTEDLELLLVSNLSANQKGKFYSLPLSRVASSAQLTSDNAIFPTLFATSKITMDFFVQTKHGSINPNAMAHSAQVPHTYELDNSPIKFVSRSGDGQFLAVAGRRGLAHYSVLSQRWKLFNNHDQEQSIRCIGGMVWYKNTLIVGCKVLGAASYQVKFFPREKNLDLLYALCTLELHSRPVYLNRIDNWLLVYTTDNLLTFYDMASDPNGRISSVTLAQKISLEGVVKSPQTVRAISWFPGDLIHHFPKMVVLMGGTLLLFTPETTDTGNTPRYKITQIADKVSHFQLLDTSLAGLYFSLWAYCQGKVKIWYQLSHLADPLAQVFNVPFHPLTLDLKQGLVFGVEQSAHDSLLVPGIYFLPSFKSHVIFHQILDYLVTNALDQEAYLFSINYEPYPYFGYGLEILLHDVLVRAPQDLPKAANLIRQFPHFPEVVVSCARKIEVALWDQLFDVVGSPSLLFEQCLASNRLDAASSCLIVLHTLESSQVSGTASAKLLRCAVDQQDMALFHNVARFIARINGTTDLESLTTYLRAQVKEADS